MCLLLDGPKDSDGFLMLTLRLRGVTFERCQRAEEVVALSKKLIRTELFSGYQGTLQFSRGYRWQLRNGIVEITNSRASKHAEAQLNKVIPVFEISEGARVKSASFALWLNLQIALDLKLKEKGVSGDLPGASSTIKPTKLRNRTVRDILSYIVVNSQAEGWIVSGPPKCLGFTPYCGLWFLIEGEPFGTSYQSIVQKVRENL